MIGYFPLPPRNSPWCGKMPCGATHPAKATAGGYSEFRDPSIAGWTMLTTLLVVALLLVIFRRR